MKKPVCKRCGNKNTVMCSHFAWNCPNCFQFIRMANKKEIKSNQETGKKVKIKVASG